MFTLRIPRIRTCARSWPWGLMCLFAAVAVVAINPLILDVGNARRRAEYSSNRLLDELVYQIYRGSLSQIRGAMRDVRDVNEPDDAGFRPLHHVVAARRDDDVQVCRMLLERGADVEGRDVAGNTPLIAAAFHNRPGVATLLLDAGADPNARNNGAVTALHAVADDPQATAIARMLLDRGADPGPHDSAGATAADRARAADNFQVMRMLERHRAAAPRKKWSRDPRPKPP